METRSMLTLLLALAAAALAPAGNAVAVESPARIAKWYGNHDGAASLRFDDNRESHVEFVVPLLDRYGFKATFLVNPGKDSYIKNRKFWEKEVVPRGHRLGNHTMHHNGAKTIEEAEYEIGEAARILRSVDRTDSGLMVFAAGGLTRWGGVRWERSSESYKRLVEKYSLIDLYDGFHEARHVNSADSPQGLCDLVRKANETGDHQAFVFHDIGSPGIKDLLIRLRYGNDLTFGKDAFRDFLDCLEGEKKKTWIAPLIDIYEYEAARKGAAVTVLENGRKLVRLRLKVATDPDVYDHKLTLVLPQSGEKISRILQEGEPVWDYKAVDDTILVDVKPRTSEIAIYRE